MSKIDKPGTGLVAGYGSTTGTDERDSRPLMEGLLAFDLPAEIARLRDEPEWVDGDRSSLTLAKATDFRVLLSVLRAGARLSEDDGDARISVQLLDGEVRLDVGRGEQPLRPGSIAVIDAGQPWRLTASGESAVLITFAWPREQARV